MEKNNLIFKKLNEIENRLYISEEKNKIMNEKLIEMEIKLYIIQTAYNSLNNYNY